MRWIFGRISERRVAMEELRAELELFAYDGLVSLREDLQANTVARGTWDGCVLSYRAGYAGSVDFDRNGRLGNTFTRLWDAGRLSRRAILEAVDAELRRRTGHLEDGPRRMPRDHGPAGAPLVAGRWAEGG